MSASVADRLLDATIQSLAENGYVATTTRRVAEIAGVSQGAQQHYFPTKAALVEAALRRLSDQLFDEARSRSLDAATERGRAAALLDMIIDIHRLPITPAVLEMFNVARTDPTLAECTATFTSEGTAAILELAHQALPTFAERPGFDDAVQVAMASARGTAILAAIPGAQDAHPSWPVLRDHLLAALDAL